MCQLTSYTQKDQLSSHAKYRRCENKLNWTHRCRSRCFSWLATRRLQLDCTHGKRCRIKVLIDMYTQTKAQLGAEEVVWLVKQKSQLHCQLQFWQRTYTVDHMCAYIKSKDTMTGVTRPDKKSRSAYERRWTKSKQHNIEGVQASIV
jgi:hypothetical protein